MSSRGKRSNYTLIFKKKKNLHLQAHNLSGDPTNRYIFFLSRNHALKSLIEY